MHFKNIDVVVWAKKKHGLRVVVTNLNQYVVSSHTHKLEVIFNNSECYSRREPDMFKLRHGFKELTKLVGTPAHLLLLS